MFEWIVTPHNVVRGWGVMGVWIARGESQVERSRRDRTGELVKIGVPRASRTSTRSCARNVRSASLALTGRAAAGGRVACGGVMRELHAMPRTRMRRVRRVALQDRTAEGSNHLLGSRDSTPINTTAVHVPHSYQPVTL